MNSGINYSIFYPIINIIYGNTFHQKIIQTISHNKQGFSPQHSDQQGLYCTPSNQPTYPKYGCNGFVLYHKQVRELIMQYDDNIWNSPIRGFLLLNQRATLEKYGTEKTWA